MSDDERIARLTQLARRVWPGQLGVRIEQSPDGGWRVLSDDWLLLAVRARPRALDALEAALLVLQSEHPVELQRVLTDGFCGPAWVEQLAADWEQRADRLERFEDSLTAMATGHEAARCAAELRARARQSP